MTQKMDKKYSNRWGVLACLLWASCWVGTGYANTELLPFQYQVLPDQTVRITAFTGSGAATEIVVPGALEGLPVRVIGSQSFAFVVTGRIVLPASVTAIERFAFLGADVGEIALQGNAPILGEDAFASPTIAAIGRPVSATGYDHPSWSGLPMRLTSPVPFQQWLLDNGLTHTLDPQTDINGNGTTLLSAYAFNLQPTASVDGKVPDVRVLPDGGLRITFFAGRADIRYQIQVSSDMTNWINIAMGSPGVGGILVQTIASTSGVPGHFVRVTAGFSSGQP